MSSLREVSKTWVERIVDGKFPLRQWLGGTERSAVFLTERDAPESQRAAIKLLPSEAFAEDTDNLRLLLWAESAKLSHPHVMRLFEYGRCVMDGESFVYIVQEYGEENLAQILPERALTADEVKEMLPSLAEGLAFLHEAGFVHSRIQPSNVMAVSDQLKISSDAICKTGEPGQRRGSAYDAPEVATVLTPAADVWSLGVLLVAVLTQREPDVNHRIDGQVSVPDAVPQPFREIAQHCLRADPRRRCTMAQILGKLKGEGSFAPTVPSSLAASAASVAVPLSSVAPKATSAPAAFTSKPPAAGNGKRIILPVILALLILAALLGRKLLVQHPTILPDASSTQSPRALTDQNAAQERPPFKPPPAATPANTPGKVRQQVAPEISAGARKTIRGQIKVNVQVSADAAGSVTQARVVRNTASKYFAKQSLSAAQHWKFDPPQSNGQPTPSEWNLRFQFGRNGTQVSSSPMKP